MENLQYTNGDYQYAFICDEAIEILRYTGNDSKLYMPESLDFLPVAHIGDEALMGCSRLTNVVIGDGIQRIGARAFSGCSSLASIHIPASVLSIDDSAFEGCPASLVFIVTPDSAAHRWADANHRCTDTASVFFQYGIYTMWPESAVIEKYTGYGGDVVLPHELDGYPVVCIWERAFRGCRTMTGIALPEGLEAIAEEAFCGCSALRRVVIPASVTAIGYDAFDGCADDLTLIAEKDSYAHRWAAERNIRCSHPER